MNMLKGLLAKIQKARNPVRYWRKRGTTIGNDCEIYSSAEFGSEPYLITLGNHVRVTGGVKFITHDGGVWVLRTSSPELRDIDLLGRIVVGNNVHIGSNAIIMPNVTIGNNCIIGCGAIVTKSIPDNSIAVGVPARVIGTIEEYASRHLHEFTHTKNMTSQQKRKYISDEGINRELV